MTNKRAPEPENMILFAAELRQYVSQYSSAESLFGERSDLILPRTQIRGQLLELAFKAFLATCGIYCEGHDLEVLADRARNAGLILSEKERESYIPNLNEAYCYHQSRDHKYLTRYPDPVPRVGVWLLPDKTPFREMIDSIVAQTKSKLAERPQ